STSETRKGLTVPFGHNIPRGLVRARKKEDVMSEMYQRLAHSSWDCKYHVVLCPSDGARCCLARHGANWEKYSTPWRGRRSARSLRDTCCRTMCTCASRFL